MRILYRCEGCDSSGGVPSNSSLITRKTYKQVPRYGSYYGMAVKSGRYNMRRRPYRRLMLILVGCEESLEAVEAGIRELRKRSRLAWRSHGHPTTLPSSSRISQPSLLVPAESSNKINIDLSFSDICVALNCRCTTLRHCTQAFPLISRHPQPIRTSVASTLSLAFEAPAGKQTCTRP